MTGSKYLDEISVSPEELEGLDIDAGYNSRLTK